MNRGQAIFLVGGVSLARKAVEFWASSVDAMLQFWLEALIGSGNSTHAKAIACARLAQLAMCMHNFFAAGAQYLCDGDETTTEAARTAAKSVHAMCNKHVDDLVNMTQALDEVKALSQKPDGSLN